MQGNGGGRGSGTGRGGGTGQGLGGTCVCPQCGHSQPHQRGVPCFEVRCPKCNMPLIRGN
ncbi:MAG: hypothetical protein R6W91_00690 [Thermoplasmata archaeon]